MRDSRIRNGDLINEHNPACCSAPTSRGTACGGRAMTTQTRQKLVLATRSFGLASIMFVSREAFGSINGPYAVDGNTVGLFHLDEAAGSTIAANAQAFTNSGIAFNQPVANSFGTTSTAVLGQTGFTAFGNAATTSANLLIGYDGD